MTNDNGNQVVPMEDVPMLFDETPETERFLVIEAWQHSHFLCKNYILSGLEDALYNVYSGVETSKELWIALEKKYKTEDARLKKFVATKFLDYKMEWWIDSGATRHICAVREAFATYAPVGSDETLFIGIDAMAKIEGSILFQGNISGLQVFKNGEWIGVEPLPYNAFVVNTGLSVITIMIMQVISNGMLKSAEHRAVTNSKDARTRMVTIICTVSFR
uniref:Uncharacterized protein n=1 Tax=Nicotiana tabacum TaxID=4097 RepID=A0A1S3YPD1_TOBAC|nr:PREDICTED: uncharacterized protein LOC107778248 [Nicotiana tabacum]